MTSGRANVLCFDIGGTLVSMPRGSLAEELGASLGVDVATVRNLLIEHGKRRRSSYPVLASALAEALRAADRRAEIERRLRARGHDMAQPDVLPGVVECLSSLREDGWTICYLTNAIGCDADALRPAYVAGEERIFASYDIGHCKPDRAAFATVEDTFDCRGHSMVCVGNSWKADIVGALKAGWSAVYVAGDADERPSHPRLRSVEDIGSVRLAVAELTGA
jgi:FMN phosphatase YigB (HAD superfamily)